MKKLLKYIFFLLLVVSLAFVYGFSNARNEVKQIQSPVIKFAAGENNFLTQAMVNKLLIQNNEIIKNQTKSVIDLHELEKTVLLNPYIESASLFMTIDGQLNTVVKQREPVVRIVTGKEDYYLDKQGVKVPLSNEYSARVPLVTGLKNDNDLKEIHRLITFINTDDFLKKEIVGIHKTNSDEYIFAVRSGNYKIEFGKLINIQQKFLKLKGFYTKTFLDEKIKEYKTINLKYHNQVVAVK